MFNRRIYKPLFITGLFLISCNTKENAEPTELEVVKVPNISQAAESYFSPDGKSLIFNAQMGDDDTYQTYTVSLDGKSVRRINDKGMDACSYYFPSGDRLLYTSTRDNLHLPEGNWSDPQEYPTGAELYTCDLDGSNVVRLTNNEYYEAEAGVSPNGEWILFGRQINGEMELWRMRPDGSDSFQITSTPDWQEGGAFYMPDNETILYRAWKRSDEGQRGLPMTIYTIKHDGTDKKQITFEEGTNWAPFPAPDGKHFVFVKVLPPHNYEIFLMNLDTGKQTRVTYNDAFDGFPSFSPDGETISFSSSRDAAEGSRALTLYTMNIESLMK